MDEEKNDGFTTEDKNIIDQTTKQQEEEKKRQEELRNLIQKPRGISKQAVGNRRGLPSSLCFFLAKQ